MRPSPETRGPNRAVEERGDMQRIRARTHIAERPETRLRAAEGDPQGGPAADARHRTPRNRPAGTVTPFTLTFPIPRRMGTTHASGFRDAIWRTSETHRRAQCRRQTDASTEPASDAERGIREPTYRCAGNLRFSRPSCGRNGCRSAPFPDRCAVPGPAERPLAAAGPAPVAGSRHRRHCRLDA
jgi:hypothetical protein